MYIIILGAGSFILGRIKKKKNLVRNYYVTGPRSIDKRTLTGKSETPTVVSRDYTAPAEKITTVRI